jgi:hypothetical protein
MEVSMRLHVRSPKVLKCICHALHAQCYIYFNSKKIREQDQKGISSEVRDRSDL